MYSWGKHADKLRMTSQLTLDEHPQTTRQPTHIRQTTVHNPLLLLISSDLLPRIFPHSLFVHSPPLPSQFSALSTLPTNITTNL